MLTFRVPEPSARTVLKQVTGALCCLALLAGCDNSSLPLDTPVDWWHQLQGGAIAQDRPPPPGVADPYPNLARVPPRPAPTDPATRRALLAQLATQRDRIKQDTAEQPIVWPVPGSLSPPRPVQPQPAAAQASRATAQAGTAPNSPTAAPRQPQPEPAEDTEGMRTTFEAATAPASPAAPPAVPADRNPPAAFTAPPRRPAAPTPPPPADGAIPALPTGAPPLPNLAGIPPAVNAPAAPRPRPSASFAFAPGSAALPLGAEAALKALAGRRANAAVQVTAGGDAASAAPAAQAAALPLALRRVRAISAALVAAGVPQAALRTDAAAPGRGGSAGLVE